MWSDMHFYLAIQCVSAMLTLVVASEAEIIKTDMTPPSRDFR
jgi:hypothetical protein